ncbi:MAG TPA: SRPBCC domain-containing protein, partial [bacterium]|nr:SRPBCC domain-containing protein [bacterium]
MTKTVQLSFSYPVPAATLYRIFVTSAQHSAATGSPGRINAKVGGRFSLFEGALTGRTLYRAPGRLLVQTWRSTSFKPGDAESILVVEFRDQGKRGVMSFLHVNVPDHDAAGIRAGWRSYYYDNWLAYLQRR